MKPLAAAAVLALALSTGVSCSGRQPSHTSSDHLVCILDISEIQNTSDRLYTGYCYDLMKDYAASRGKTVEIRLAKKSDDLRNCLLRGKADIVCTPLETSLMADSLHCSSPVDSLFLCFTGMNDTAESILLESWILSYNLFPGREQKRNMYLNPFNPATAGKSFANRDFICPYDTLLKKAGRQSGFDWRLLAALLFHESRFHIEAVSPYGAAGLSQMTPATAAAMGVTDFLDPESNIMGGAMYLREVYGKLCDDKCDNLLKFTLAAYNSGLGNLARAREGAISAGLDPNVWDNVRKSNEYSQTASYVDAVLSTYNAYKTIPE